MAREKRISKRLSAQEKTKILAAAAKHGWTAAQVEKKFGVIAGVLHELQQSAGGREPEVVLMAFATRGTALVPVGAVPEECGAPTAGD
jgi:hypothetical protein